MHRLYLVPVLLILTSCSTFFLSPHNAEKAQLYLQKGVDHYAQKQYSQAIEATQEALRLNPSLAAGYNHLALIYMETKRYERAEESFKQALVLQPNYPEVLNNLGVLRNRQEKFQDAIAVLEKALADDKYTTPENAYTNLGYSYYKLGSMVKAKAYHQKALDISPQFCLASKNLGDVYAKEKNYQKAADYFQKAVTNCPLYQESQYKLGLVMMKMGQRTYAKNHLERLIERHQDGPYVERSAELLKFLK